MRALTEAPAMARWFRVKLNLELLIAHLAREEARSISKEYALRWLADAGFSRVEDDVWDVCEPDLGQLDPSEVTAMNPINEPA